MMKMEEALPEMKFVQTRKFVQTHPGFKVIPHSDHTRLYHVELNQERLQEFLRQYADIGPQNLEYIPYMRYVLAGKTKNCLAKSWKARFAAFCMTVKPADSRSACRVLEFQQRWSAIPFPK
ncbi:carbon starvation induced protein CsiD [Ferviditalea candida]|uniref:Carbon starvation induced protein CsiD n=1 Tax=Ferviditalea candida TaxID=3108399 RepID=A0ABU5ZI96_9BACL|nr:carbon starvation induced protein CsiD [Paenibacillaceae bacterium T2]